MYCIDSNIIIFFLKNINPRLSQRLLQELAQDAITTTSINASEILYYSFKNKATRSLEARKQLLEKLNIADFDYESAIEFAKTKAELESKGQKVDDADLQIASICLTNNFVLITNNTKHFENITGLKIQDWS